MKMPYEGRIDLVDQDGCIIDLKTKAKKYSEKAVLISHQLTGYQAVLEAEGMPVTGLAFHCLVKVKGGNVQVLKSLPRSKEEIWAWKLAYAANVNAIRGQTIWPPCDPDNALCSPRYCGYYGTVCKYRVLKEDNLDIEE
jgi:hypothetical protein